MSLYEPLRESFREFNRLIIDQQQWEGQHAAREADAAYNHSRLQSDLLQREFDNTMAQESLALRARGLDLEADRVDISRIGQKFDHEQRTEAAGRDARRLEMEEKESQISRAKGLYELRDLKAPHDPHDVNFSAFIPEHIKSNVEAMTELSNFTSSTMGGAVVEDDGTVTRDGVPIQMSDKELQEYAPGMQGWLSKWNDPLENAKTNIATLENSKSELNKTVKGDHYLPYEKAAAKRQINKINSQIADQQKIFDPSNAMSVYGQRAQAAYNGALWLRKIDMHDEADAQEELAKTMLEKALASKSSGKGNMIQLYKEDLDKDGKAVGMGKATYDTSTQIYSYPDAKGNIAKSTLLPKGITALKPETKGGSSSSAAAAVSKQRDAVYKWGAESVRKSLSPTSDIMDTLPDQKAGIDYAEGLYARMAELPVLGENGEPTEETAAPTTNQEAARLKTEVIKQYRINHNNAYKDYLEAKKSPDRLAEWRDAVLNEFGYLPTMPFVDQIWLGTSKTNK